jgi:hypothetical protein
MKPFVTRDKFVFDMLAVLEGLKAVALNGREMDEDVLAIGTDYEAKTLLRIEPLHRPGNTRHGLGLRTPENARRR